MTPDFKATALASLMVIGAALIPVQSNGHDYAPSPRALAVVDIPAPREGRLMHLAGVKGHGIATVRIPGTGTCRAFSVVMVAGGFWGMEHDADVGPVRILINDPFVVKRLARGRDIVSGDYRVSAGDPHSNADLVVLSGLPQETGFILDRAGMRLGPIGRQGQRASCAPFRSDYPDRQTGSSL